MEMLETKRMGTVKNGVKVAQYFVVIPLRPLQKRGMFMFF